MLSKRQDRPATGPIMKRQHVVLDLDTKSEIYAKLQQGASHASQHCRLLHGHLLPCTEQAYMHKMCFTHQVYTMYRIAGKFDGELNLVVWRSGLRLNVISTRNA